MHCANILWMRGSKPCMEEWMRTLQYPPLVVADIRQSGYLFACWFCIVINFIVANHGPLCETITWSIANVEIVDYLYWFQPFSLFVPASLLEFVLLSCVLICVLSLMCIKCLLASQLLRGQNERCFIRWKRFPTWQVYLIFSCSLWWRDDYYCQFYLVQDAIANHFCYPAMQGTLITLVKASIHTASYHLPK